MAILEAAEVCRVFRSFRHWIGPDTAAAMACPPIHSGLRCRHDGCDLLKCRNVRRLVIVAHSISCIVAHDYAIQYPSWVAGLVLVTPFCHPTRPTLMPMLRLATLPVVSGLMSRWLYPLLADRIGLSWWSKAMAPHPLPHYPTAMPLVHPCSVPPDQPQRLLNVCGLVAWS